MQTSAKIRDLTESARKFYQQAEQAKASTEAGAVRAIEKAWQCGKILNQIKQTIGHGNWLVWLEANWRDFSVRTATSYMKIDSDNPNALQVADLKFDSIRKYRIASLVPQKARVQLKGDKRFARSSHYSTVVIECNKLSQRIDAGQYEIDEADLLRDFRPFFDWLARRYDGVARLAAGQAAA